MNIGAALVADSQAAEAIQPSQRALDHPAMPAEAFAGIDAFAGDADPDVTLGQGPAAAGIVVALVGMQLGGAFAPLASRRLDRRDGIEQRIEDHRVVAIGPRQQRGEREAAALDHNMALRSRFPPIRRVGTDEDAPLLAGMLALSRATRLQSRRSAAPRRSSSSRWSRSHTPAACQSRSRRQQVMPEPQPISWGSISQGMPDFRTKIMPVSAARSGTRGRPPLGLGSSGGSSGATTAHSSSLTRDVLMRQVCHARHQF